MPDQVELITYVDRFGGTLKGLRKLLDGPLSGLFGGVHTLPFFRPYDGADAGFDPEDHTAVDPRLGTWDDVAAMARTYDVMVDVIVNHVSARARPFLDWLAKGKESEFDGMFLTFGGAFPDGATEEQLARLYRPRPGLPFTPYVRRDGSKRLLWTTFTPQQIDIDVRHPITRAYLLRVLDCLVAAGVRRARLDAVGYAVKTPGLTSFMTPETFRFIDEVTAWCHDRGLDVLVEVHSYYQQQLAIARRVDRVYDFALPTLILHGLLMADVEPLLAWLQIRPRNAVTVLDTHDGIGVVDVGPDATDHSRAGLLTSTQIDRLVEAMHEASGGSSRLATGAAASNVDLYQVNCTFYDALGADDNRYLLARALQFWTPGIPQIYYVGLLAGANDMKLLARTGIGRDVNRHHYTLDEIYDALQRPVVRALMRLIRFRNSHPAFDGDFAAIGCEKRITLIWEAAQHHARLDANFTTGHAEITWTTSGGRVTANLADLP
jgi:sucrose phosphorylase